MSGAVPPFPQYVFMAWCLVKHRGNFTFTISCFIDFYLDIESDEILRKFLGIVYIQYIDE
jgi:hypothetical protein